MDIYRKFIGADSGKLPFLGSFLGSGWASVGLKTAIIESNRDGITPSYIKIGGSYIKEQPSCIKEQPSYIKKIKKLATFVHQLFSKNKPAILNKQAK